MTVDPLIVDCYELDLNGMPKWSLLASLGMPWCGGIVKATQGVGYSPGWFANNWRAIRIADEVRYGETWFRGCYHYLKFNLPGAAQADYYLRAVTNAGGWSVGDLWPIVDVELGGDKDSNRNASKQQVIDCTSAFSRRVKAVTGRDIMLYGNGAMRDLGINDRMGCSWLWLPRYTETLPATIYERAGWTVEQLVAWQYSGDGVGVLPGYPMSPPGFGRVDTSVITLPGGIERLRSLLWAEHP